MSKGKVLVTGASGFLGRRTVEILSERGFPVRALVRKTSKIGNLKQPGVEIYVGDVTDISTLQSAFEGIDVVVHTAADTSGTKEGAQRVTVGGTRNILDLCTSHQVRKLVYISSCSVYGLADCREDQIIDEKTPLERYPERRGVYSWAKVEAEKLVLDHMDQGKAAIACLRPGTIYGPGGENYTCMMGFSLGKKSLVVIRNDGFILPLVYVDNLVDAIIRSMVQGKSTGHVYNVVDTQQIDKKQYMNAFIRKLRPDAWCFYLPHTLLYSAVCLQEQVFRVIRAEVMLTRYRLISSQKPVIYDSSRIINDLGWQSYISFEEAVTRIMVYGRRKLN